VRVQPVFCGRSFLLKVIRHYLRRKETVSVVLGFNKASRLGPAAFVRAATLVAM